MQQRAILMLVALPLLLCSSAALADDLELESSTGAVAWQPDWRKSSLIDYSVTAVGFAAALTLHFTPNGERSEWQRPIWFDRELRAPLVADGVSGRNQAARVSDILVAASIGHVVVDSTLVSMGVHGAFDLGYEMLVMDAEAYALTMLLNGVAKRIIARERPDGSECARASSYDSTCSMKERYVSFYSGHAATSATSAGLVCAHHQQLALYGGTWDGAACGASIVMSAFIGGLRIVGDRHWASDVLTGHLLGFASGYLIPTLFHYRRAPSRRNGSALRGLLPQPELAGASLVVFGVL